MNIYIIRHSESEGDIEPLRHEGRANFKATKHGEEQIEKLGEYIKKTGNVKGDVVFSSPLFRTLQCANKIKQTIGKEIILMEELMEWNNGVLAGLEKTIAKEIYPKTTNRPSHESVIGGESELDFRFRCEKAWSVIEKYAKEYKCDSIIIVSHGGTISNLLNAILKMPVNSTIHFKTGDTGVHLVEKTEDGKTKVVYLNNQILLESKK